MEQFAQTYGVPGSVILLLVSTLLWVVRLVVTGRLIPVKYYDDAVKRGDNLEAANKELLSQNTELVTDRDLGVELLRALRAFAAAKRGED